QEMTDELQYARDWAADTSLPLDQRLDALELTRFAPFADREEQLFAPLNVQQPREIQRSAMGQLSAESSNAVAQKLLDRWDELGPEIRYDAGNVLLHRRHNHDLLLTALESGRINIGQLNMDLERRRTLLFADDASTRERASKLFTDAG